MSQQSLSRSVMDLAEDLRLRHIKRWSQITFADDVGIHYKRYLRLKDGEGDLKLEEVERIANALGFSGSTALLSRAEHHVGRQGCAAQTSEIMEKIANRRLPEVPEQLFLHSLPYWFKDACIRRSFHEKLYQQTDGVFLTRDEAIGKQAYDSFHSPSELGTKTLYIPEGSIVAFLTGDEPYSSFSLQQIRTVWDRVKQSMSRPGINGAPALRIVVVSGSSMERLSDDVRLQLTPGETLAISLVGQSCSFQRRTKTAPPEFGNCDGTDAADKSRFAEIAYLFKQLETITIRKQCPIDRIDKWIDQRLEYISNGVQGKKRVDMQGKRLNTVLCNPHY